MVELTSNSTNSQFWKELDIIHGLFQITRTMMRFGTLAHPNTSSEIHPHPVSDARAERFEDGLGLGLDEDGTASTMAFNALSLVYLIYFLTVTVKWAAEERKKQTKEDGEPHSSDLPSRIGYALREAGIWSCTNLTGIFLARFAENQGIADVAFFSLFSLAMVLDTWNSVYESTKAIEKNKQQQEEETDTFKLNLLKTEAILLQCKRVSAITLGSLAVAGGTCWLASNVFYLVEGASSLTAAHLSFAGGTLLLGGAIIFTVVRLVSEVRALDKESQLVKAELRSIEAELMKTDILPDRKASLNEQKEGLRRQQTEIQYNLVKCTAFYIAQLGVISVSYFAGPIPGLIAFAGFFVWNVIYRHLIESRVQRYLGIGKADENAPIKAPVTASAGLLESHVVPAPGYHSRTASQGAAEIESPRAVVLEFQAPQPPTLSTLALAS